MANDHGVNIFLGNGDGTFPPFVAYATEIATDSVALGDFNGDGKLDLAVASSFSAVVLLGNGNGTFGPGMEYAAGASPVSLAVGDFNDDGRLDMAVTGTTVSVLLQPGLIGPNATPSPTILMFDNELVGSMSPAQSVTLSNNGTATLNITNIAASANFSETDNCGSNLAIGGSCNINATFVPTVGGNLAGTISITDNAPGSPQTVTLSGVSTAVTLVPNSITFNCSLAICESRTAQLTNLGATPLSIQSITITSNKAGVNDHGGFAQTNNCGTSLGAGQACSFTVSFVGQGNFKYTGALIVQDSARPAAGNAARVPHGVKTGAVGLEEVPEVGWRKRRANRIFGWTGSAHPNLFLNTPHKKAVERSGTNQPITKSAPSVPTRREILGRFVYSRVCWSDFERRKEMPFQGRAFPHLDD